MKKRLHDQKAGIVILAALLIISLIETVVRAAQPNYAFAVTDLGEPFAIAIFAAMTMVFTLAKKDRTCYICYGAFIAWFVLEEALSLPGTLKSFFDALRHTEIIASMTNGSAAITLISILLHLLTSICIVAIGALVVEYIDDGTICNRAFNVFCVVAVLLLLIAAGINLVGFATVQTVEIGLLILNNLHRILMIFLFTFFAYDSAKNQLKKANLTK